REHHGGSTGGAEVHLVRRPNHYQDAVDVFRGRPTPVGIPGLQVREDVERPTTPLVGPDMRKPVSVKTRRQVLIERPPSGGEMTPFREVVQKGDTDLFQVILAAGAIRGLAHFLDGGQQETDQDADNGNDHQQLDQRKPARTAPKNKTGMPHGRTSTRAQRKVRTPIQTSEFPKSSEVFGRILGTALKITSLKNKSTTRYSRKRPHDRPL